MAGVCGGSALVSGTLVLVLAGGCEAPRGCGIWCGAGGDSLSCLFEVAEGGLSLGVLLSDSTISLMGSSVSISISRVSIAFALDGIGVAAEVLLVSAAGGVFCRSFCVDGSGSVVTLDRR